MLSIRVCIDGVNMMKINRGKVWSVACDVSPCYRRLVDVMNICSGFIRNDSDVVENSRGRSRSIDVRVSMGILKKGQLTRL